MVVRSFGPSVLRSFVLSFGRSFVRSFVRPFGRSFGRLVVLSGPWERYLSGMNAFMTREREGLVFVIVSLSLSQIRLLQTVVEKESGTAFTKYLPSKKFKARFDKSL